MSTSPKPETASGETAPARLWDRQPGESARDYLDFVAWLQSPVRRPLRAAAVNLKLTASRLRTLSARHHWRGRAFAYDEFRANSTQAMLDRVLQSETCSLAERAEVFREQEWALHELMVEQARAALRATRITRRRVPSLHAIARLLELASFLGRRSCGLPPEGAPAQKPETSNSPEFEAAIRRIYGEPQNDSAAPAVE